MTFNPNKRLVEGSSTSVPCGSCIGCRIDRSREAAVRCMHEAKLYPNNCFVTLTYDDAHLPPDYSVDVVVVQKFMRALRKTLDHRIRYFACGEYGDQNLRPHYHVLIFNHDFSDKKLFSTKNGNNLYTSTQLQKLWPYGFSTIGSLTYQTAAYTARYIVKKIGGEAANDHYLRVHPVSGHLVRVQREFATRSLKPGLGYDWLQQFKADVYPSDFIIVDGKKHPIPKYYTRKLTEEEQHKLKVRRVLNSHAAREHQTPERLKAREGVKLAQVAKLKREI